jgi:hypothetical protein
MRLREYGNPQQAGWHQQTLDDCSGILATLCERECEHMEEHGSKTYGNNPLAVRLDLVEKARELIDVALNGDLAIMRKVLKQVNQQTRS